MNTYTHSVQENVEIDPESSLKLRKLFQLFDKDS